MAEIKGGERVVKALRANGIDTLFAIPGVQLDPVFAALHDVRASLRVIHPRHEQCAALMAFGYAQVTGRPGALLVVPGPGFLNAATGLLTAHACNAPVLCLAGQCERHFIGAGVGVLHELEDQMGIAARLCKWTRRVETPEDIAPAIGAALSAMVSGRPRPAYVELPSDVLRMGAPADAEAPMPVPRPPPAPRQRDIERLAEALAGARYPLIIAGGGARRAGAAVQALAQRLGAPVGMSENGLGTIDCRHPLAFTQLGAHKHWARADVVLALGTRLHAPVFNWGWDAAMRIFKVDVDSRELHRLPLPLESLHGDAAQVAGRLLEVLPDSAGRGQGGSESRLREVREGMARELVELAPARDFLHILREEMGESGILVCDVTQLNHAALDLFPVHRPATYLSSGYQGALGFGPGTAMGAKVGRPDVPVVCLVGDGGFMYAAQELATAVQFGIAVVMLVINDGAYQNVENTLNANYGGRALATRLHNPDFVQLAQSCGAAARRVHGPREMRLALRELLARNVPALIDYRGAALPSAFWLRFLPQVRKHAPANPHGLVSRQN